MVKYLFVSLSPYSRGNVLHFTFASVYPGVFHLPLQLAIAVPALSMSFKQASTCVSECVLAVLHVCPRDDTVHGTVR